MTLRKAVQILEERPNVRLRRPTWEIGETAGLAQNRRYITKVFTIMDIMANDWEIVAAPEKSFMEIIRETRLALLHHGIVVDSEQLVAEIYRERKGGDG